MAHPTSDRNFRLSPTARPSRYVAHLDVDPAGKTFRGQATVALNLDAASNEIVLHAAELELGSASFRAKDGGAVAATIELVAVSETAVLRFARELPKGSGTLELAWTGRFN